VASWFCRLCNAQSDFTAKERIVWVDIEGVPLNAWSRSTFQKIASKLISCQCKKQTVVATSLTEAEYVAAASGCAQVLWIQNQLLDYGNMVMEIVVLHILGDALLITTNADVTKLQALVDKKKIVISEVVIREILQLDDAKGVVCLPNEEIFAGLAQMGYEKPLTKLTFYKAFFSSQWKFLIHNLLQSLSAKRTSWNEFSTSMASTVICLSKGQKFNFSKYIFDSLVCNVDSSSKFYMYPWFIQLIIQNQVGDLSTHTTRYISPALTQKVFANMRKVRKGFSGVETPLFAGMLVAREVTEEGLVEEQVQADGAVATAVQENVTVDVTNEAIPSPPSHDIPSPSQEHTTPPQQLHISPPAPPQGEDFPAHLQQVLDTCSALTRHVEHLEHDNVAQKLEIIKIRARVKRLEKANQVKSLKLKRLRKVGTSQQIESSDDMEDVFNQGRMINEDEGIELVKDADITEIKGRHAAEQAKKQAEIYNLDLDHPSKVLSMQEDDSEVQEVVEVVTTAKLITDYMKRYHGMKKKPQTEGEARKNMMFYLKNTAGYKMDFFKGMSYDEIRPIFQARFNANMRFLFKTREEIKEEDQEIIKSINETLAHKAAKRRKLNEEAQEAEDLKKHLEIVNDEDDDVYTEATPLGRKVPVVDYQIVMINNKPRYKIIKADETHQLYISFITLLKNFDREDLEDLWRIVKERFSTSKPSNFSDDYLLATLKTMFEKPNGQDAVWRNQNTVYDQALHAQPEDSNKLLQKLLEDLQIINNEQAKYINSLSWDCPTFFNDNEDHSVQYKEYLENSSNEIAVSNHVKEKPPQDSDIRQLIREDCCIENFRVIHKNSISLNNMSQISLVYVIAPVLPTEEPEYSLSMGYEHLSTISETEFDEVIKSSVKNLLPILIFTTFSNPLFDDNDDFTSSDDESLSNEDVPMEDFKVYSNSLFDDEEINSDKLNPHCFNVKYDFVESLSNRDTLIDSSLKFDFLEEFSSAFMPTSVADEERIRRELAEYISLMERLFTINPCPCPMENSNTIVETLPTSPILIEDSDSQREEIDIFTGTDELLPPKNESFYFDHQDNPSFPRPPSEPPDDKFDFEPNSGEVISAVMNNIDEFIEDECFDRGGEIDVFKNLEDDDYFPFIFVIRIFLPYLIYPEVSPLLLFAGSEDTIFDPGISV
nr:glutamic acid-rich protein-like [Tanacetum cinerariifolium]